MTTEPTDEALYDFYVNEGDERALEALVRRHWAPLFKLARGIVGETSEAEDVAQEAFVSLVAAARKKIRLKPVRGWLRTVVTNDARKVLRARGRRERRETEAASQRPVAADETDPVAAIREYAEALPENWRQSLVLHFGHGLTHAEVGKVLSVPASTASLWIKEAVAQVRQKVEARPALLALVPLETALVGLGDDGAPVAPFPSFRLVTTREPREMPRRAYELSYPAWLVVGLVFAMTLVGGLGFILIALMGDEPAAIPTPTPSPVARTPRVLGAAPVFSSALGIAPTSSEVPAGASPGPR